MRRAAFRTVWAAALPVGVVSAWLAQGYREGTALERALIFPAWAPTRVAYRGLYALLMAVAK